MRAARAIRFFCMTSATLVAFIISSANFACAASFFIIPRAVRFVNFNDIARAYAQSFGDAGA